ncbi:MULTISPECIES: WD40/YVTN/BNR-like repeat-containing protein [Pseudomonas]|uniref:WD40/YVTN/BNR-like repeat-containing protein n=1 Tax=Pseudomonas TaxID=286 RepID=UPI001BECECC6|nr:MULTISPECIES: YCF48-related protein [Pseudomonas]MBT2339820.1 glycosyl hydrolase [Pseudomonas fluorescens]MCD4530334.1 YCF48-related protein [Pseudomonas sp. C3-2018]
MIGKFSLTRTLPVALLLAALLVPGLTTASPRIALLDQPALQSARAARAVLLAVTRAGERLVAVGERGIVLLSDDSGMSWRQARVPVSVSLTAVQFVDAEQGWAVGHMGVILHSTDGGETWVKQLDGMAAAKLALVQAQQGDDPKQLKDAERLVADGPDKPFLDLYFRDRRDGYAVGAYGLILRTVDGGNSWQPWMGQVENPDDLNLYGIRAAGNALFIVGERGLLLRSNDNGRSFQALESPYDGSFFGLLGSSTGELVAFGLRGNAYWSADEGASWRPIETGLEVALSSATKLTDGTWVLASQAGDVLLSLDKGGHFRHSPGPAAPSIAGVVAAPDGNLIGVGLSGPSRLDHDLGALR